MSNFFDDLSKPCPHPVGTRVEVISMPDEPSPLPVGTLGTVTGGNAAQVYVEWDGGSNLSLLPGIDKWKVVVNA